jgi:membrane-bound metal-dependent hydrolase YbcI (DUF457 family)
LKEFSSDLFGFWSWHHSNITRAFGIIKLCGINAAMPFDIGIGLILGIVASSDLGISSIEGALLGVFVLLLPDLDFLLYRLRRHSPVEDYKHRDILHKPIPYLIVIGLFCAIVVPSALPLVLVASLAHFIHDSVGIGWGVPWLWPFSKDHFGFAYHIADPTRPNGSQFRGYFRWRERQLGRQARIEGDPDWIRHIYLRPHPYAVVEYAVLALGIAITLLSI